MKPAETGKEIKAGITLWDSRYLGEVERTKGSSVLQTCVEVCCETCPCRTFV